MFYTYILQSESTGKYYVGQTNNLGQRLLRHNTHPDTYTKTVAHGGYCIQKSLPREPRQCIEKKK